MKVYKLLVKMDLTVVKQKSKYAISLWSNVLEYG